MIDETIKTYKKELSKFSDFKFFPEDHHYEFKGKKVGISVTRLIEDYANEFDQQGIAQQVASRDGKKVTEVLKEWKYKNQFACSKGTDGHNFAQSLWSKEEYKEDLFDNSNEFKKALIKIKAQARNFYEDYKDTLEHLYDEFVIGSEEYDIASAIDHLFVNKLTGELVLVDYKTNSTLRGYNDDEKNKRYIKPMRVPLQNINDVTIEHYYIQLSIYKFLLEKYTNLKVDEMFIVYFSENISDYEIIEIPYLKKEVELILENRRVKNMNSIPVLIMGASGTGKTRSLKNLPINETAIINVTNKPLPFKNNGLKVVHSENYEEIITSLKNTKRKIIVIDDCGYLLTFENFDKATNKGYDKFTVMAQNFYKLINTVRNLDGEKIVYLITHEEVDDDNKIKPKMIGKMLNQQLCVEGLFTIVLRSNYKNNQYVFETKTDGISVAKSPEEMFVEDDIPNDLAEVDKAIREYYGFEQLSKNEINNESEGK